MRSCLAACASSYLTELCIAVSSLPRHRPPQRNILYVRMQIVFEMYCTVQYFAVYTGLLVVKLFIPQHRVSWLFPVAYFHNAVVGPTFSTGLPCNVRNSASSTLHVSISQADERRPYGLFVILHTQVGETPPRFLEEVQYKCAWNSLPERIQIAKHLIVLKKFLK